MRELRLTSTRRAAIALALVFALAPLFELSSPAAEGQYTPQTEITSATIRPGANRAKFEFTGSGGVPPLTFHCRIDGRQWRSCASPKRYRNLSEGRHVFKVRAQDQDGVVDPTPARRRFRV